MKKQTLLTLAMLAIAALGIRESQAQILFEAAGSNPGAEGWTVSSSGDGTGGQAAPSGVGTFLGSGASEFAWQVNADGANSAGTNFTETAERSLGQTLGIGESIEVSFSFNSNGDNANGAFAIGLLRPDDSFSARLNMNANGSSYRFTVNGGANLDSGVDSVDNADRLFRFTIVDATTLQLELEDGLGNELFSPYVVTVPDVTILGNEIVGIRADAIGNTDASGFDQVALNFNKVTLIPEPTSAALLLGGFGLLMLRRRR